MEKESSYGLTRALMKATSTITTFTVAVNTYGLMAEFSMETGLTTVWRAKAYSPGATAANI